MPKPKREDMVAYFLDEYERTCRPPPAVCDFIAPSEWSDICEKMKKILGYE